MLFSQILVIPMKSRFEWKEANVKLIWGCSYCDLANLAINGPILLLEALTIWIPTSTSYFRLWCHLTHINYYYLIHRSMFPSILPTSKLFTTRLSHSMFPPFNCKFAISSCKFRKRLLTYTASFVAANNNRQNTWSLSSTNNKLEPLSHAAAVVSSERRHHFCLFTLAPPQAPLHPNMSTWMCIQFQAFNCVNCSNVLLV